MFRPGSRAGPNSPCPIRCLRHSPDRDEMKIACPAFSSAFCDELSISAWLPPESPLPMAPQNLAEAPRSVLPREHRPMEVYFWRVLAAVLTGLLMWVAGCAARGVLMVNGLSALDVLGLALFELLFGWIAFSAVISLIGFAGACSSD